MTEEQRQALKKGDDIDDISTTDLEQEEAGPPNFNEITTDFFENNRINLAKAFFGMDGGYSIRKLKKFMKQDKQQQKDDF